jgi:hypothetical protein
MAALAKYQIFLSSTYEDLRDERDQVIKAVLEMGHIPVGMEMFSAADEEQWQIISRHIDESDYYVVIVAQRLGSLTPEGISYTRKEYEYARSKGIPCLGFIIDEAAKWPANQVDKDSAKKADLDSFKALVREKPVSSWTTAEDLHGKVSIALMKAFTAQPREGWVRASSLMGPEAATELIRLSAENAALRKQVAASEEAAANDHRTRIRELVRKLDAAKRTPSYRLTPRDPWLNDAEVSLFAAFDLLGPELVVERSIPALASTLAMQLRTDKSNTQWDIVALNQMNVIMADLMTLGVVQPSDRKHPVSDKDEYWTLTPLGVELLKVMREFQLTPLPAAEEDAAASSADASGNADAAAAPPESPKARPGKAKAKSKPAPKRGGKSG